MRPTHDRPDPHRVNEAVRKHADLVELLLGGPHHKRDLADELGVSSNTVYRKTRELREHRLLERGSDGYRLTNFGKLLGRMNSRLRDRTARICSCEDLISECDSGSVPPYWIWGDSDPVYPDQCAPNRPIEVALEFVRAADRLEGFSPVVDPRMVREIRRRLEDDGLSGQLVLEKTALRDLQVDLRETLSETVTGSELDVLEAPVEYPYSMWLCLTAEPTVLLTFYGPNGGVRGTIENRTADAIDWAQETYEVVREDAVPFAR